jgi:hypothetical protein
MYIKYKQYLLKKEASRHVTRAGSEKKIQTVFNKSNTLSQFGQKRKKEKKLMMMMLISKWSTAI